jgi:hypothetical protein
MKTLKQLAIVALLCYGASASAAIFAKKLSREEVDKIKARAETADLKQVDADIKNLRKHGNVKAAGHVETTLRRRTLELVQPTAKLSMPAQEAVPAEPAPEPVQEVAQVAQPAPTKPLTKNQLLDAELKRVEDEFDEMSAKKDRGEISKEDFKKYVDEYLEANRKLFEQYTIEI